MNILDPNLTTAPVSAEFLQALEEQMQDKYDVLFGVFSFSSDTEPEEHMVDQSVPQYGQVLQHFSTISIFQTTSQFNSALKVRFISYFIVY